MRHYDLGEAVGIGILVNGDNDRRRPIFEIHVKIKITFAAKLNEPRLETGSRLAYMACSSSPARGAAALAYVSCCERWRLSLQMRRRHCPVMSFERDAGKCHRDAAHFVALLVKYSWPVAF